MDSTKDIVERGVDFCPVCGIIGDSVRKANDKCYVLCFNCTAQREHAENCRWAVANRCPVGIACDHGYDLCAECDACDCGRDQKEKVCASSS